MPPQAALSGRLAALSHPYSYACHRELYERSCCSCCPFTVKVSPIFIAQCICLLVSFKSAMRQLKLALSDGP